MTVFDENHEISTRICADDFESVAHVLDLVDDQEMEIIDRDPRAQ